MKLNCNHLRVRIAIGDSRGFSSRCRTAIKDLRSMSNQSRYKLRSFVLNRTEAFAESLGSGDVSALHSPRRCKKGSGSQFDSFGAQSLFRFRMPETDRGNGNGLIAPANSQREIEPVSPYPAVNQPLRMGAAGGES